MAGILPRDLISEVKSRPGLYDRDALELPRRDKRHQLWLEVAENLTPAEDWEEYTESEKVARSDEIQTKWKHLRDVYNRELKLIDAGEAHKKRKYVYFDDMNFIRPFIGFYMPPLRKDKETHKSPKTKDDDTHNNDNGISNSGDDMGETVQEDIETIEVPNLRPRRTIETPPKAIPKQSPRFLKSSKNQRQDFKKQPSASSKHINTTTANHSLKISDGDVTFCLSLVPTLRKINDSKKLRAKIEILKVLHNYTAPAENSRYLKRSADRGHNKNSQDGDNEDETNMPEDYLEDNEEVEAGVNVKTETHDPLNGNNKIWWT